jgi:hypothetical protein
MLRAASTYRTLRRLDDARHNSAPSCRCEPQLRKNNVVSHLTSAAVKISLTSTVHRVGLQFVGLQTSNNRNLDRAAAFGMEGMNLSREMLLVLVAASGVLTQSIRALRADTHANSVVG